MGRLLPYVALLEQEIHFFRCAARVIPWVSRSGKSIFAM